MITYLYNKQSKPPAPFVHVTLRRPDRSKEIANVPARIDSGASRTVLPARFVEELDLVVVDTLLFEGFGGTVIESNTYAVLIQVHDLATHVVEVASNPKESWILLGLDMLNHHRLLLDGPQLRLGIE